jgi:hypothetical protein
MRHIIGVLSAVLVFVAVPQLIVDFMVLMESGSDLNPTQSGLNVFDWHWLPVVMIPELVVVAGLLACLPAHHYFHLSMQRGVAAVLIIGFLSVFAIFPIAQATHYHVINGLPYQRGTDPYFSTP